MLFFLVGALLMSERLWKWWMVEHFFAQPIPPARPVRLVSIIQPILSGDPTLAACLEANLSATSSYQREFLWLVDSDDTVGQHLCHNLIAANPDCCVRLIVLPPPGERENPKMIKLIAAAQLAHGEILCVLDDDTVLPTGGLELCLPWLDQPGVGLAFGLPYYTSFANLWSRLVAFFVNSNSLLTYIPYTAICEPLTINGMFYALRRDIFERIGGFAGLESTLADDFAVAQRVREHGLRLQQTAVCHGISTIVVGPRRYLSLIQRWFIFPRESLLRHLPWKHLLVLYGLVALPIFFPWLALLAALIWPSVWTIGFALLYFGISYCSFVRFDQHFFAKAAPLLHSWLVPLIQLTFPLQLLAALLVPQRINWRGHHMQVEHGGGFRFIRRRE